MVNIWWLIGFVLLISVVYIFLDIKAKYNETKTYKFNDTEEQIIEENNNETK